MDAVIANLIEDKPLAIFSKSSCCMSHSIKTLMRNFGANATVYELDELPNSSQIESSLWALGCNPSVPAVFIGQKLVGGADEIMSLHLKGELVPLLIKANVIWL